METKEEPIETPAAFLKALGDSLKAREDVDSELAGILATHILKVDPAKSSVVQAKDAILKLATERASPQKADVNNG